INNDIYEKIMQRLSFKGIRFAVDTSGELLRNVLKYKPFVIKPNTCELEELCGSPLKNDEDIIFAAKQLKEAGAVNVLVSMGKNGALLIDEAGNVYRSEAVGKRAVNTVGAGDSMLAGFLAGIGKGYDYAFKLSLAAGGATAGTEDLATKEQIEELMN
ncbi:MAG: bifunctional hydroxymethylpyrimidine kinase/phosphomethylpyrimidine kinase, partial [Clostridia bacterium]|nr:bifunctional hydroxymethylpyrimidine kinase/phosphomethylpyrimidine kinase [Clostridia bacterium]